MVDARDQRQTKLLAQAIGVKWVQATSMDIRLEVVLPVADVQQAEAFYEALGWRVDPGQPGVGNVRVVQLTPLVRRSA